MLPIVTSLIANGLGTLASAVANKGQEFIEDKLGIKLGPLLTTEDGKLKLAQLEHDKQEMLLQFALEDRKVDLEIAKNDTVDRGSARTASVAISTSDKADWLNKNTVPILAFLTIGACLYGLIWSINTASDVKYALAAFGGQILTYFFGSSSLAWKQQGTISKLGDKL